jgi:hypothetical protein
MKYILYILLLPISLLILVGVGIAFILTEIYYRLFAYHRCQGWCRECWEKLHGL